MLIHTSPSKNYNHRVSHTSRANNRYQSFSTLPTFHTQHQKINHICSVIRHHEITPKKFIDGFLNNMDPAIITKRCMWGSERGATSTFEVVESIRKCICSDPAGRLRWQEYILSQAKECIKREGRGRARRGPFQSSNSVTADFFSLDSKALREEATCEKEMPFLYSLIKSRLVGTQDSVEDNESNNFDSNDLSGSESSNSSDEETTEAIHAKKGALDRRGTRKNLRTHVVAANLCAIVQYVSNRRVNGFPLMNSVYFLATGVSERVATYLSFIGLCSSRKAANSALASLGRKAEEELIRKIAISSSSLMNPIICIDNIDFEQSVHSKSAEKQSRMFHGTWGYVHNPDPKILETLNPLDFSVQSYRDAIAKWANMSIQPHMLIPSKDENKHFSLVIKSQISRVLFQYVVTQTGKFPQIPVSPPEIDPITPQVPDITMLKLMLASDNSAEGISEVFQGILQQSKIEKKDFFDQLRVFEGDLGTCMYIESLRALRRPSSYPQDSMSNCITIMGAAHTLWNFAQAIFLLHFGNNSDAQDLGAWHSMSSLGIPSDRPNTKKDFTLMISNMTKVHEANILNCLMIVMGAENTPLPKEKVPLSGAQIEEIVGNCYTRFFSPFALREAQAKKDAKHINLLLRFRDFATVVECNRAMRAGDVGRLINIWRQWSVMAQGIKGLTKYAIHLPRLVLLITKVLPQGLQAVIKHSLLVSPSGRPGHFVAKDHYLEIKNYWLKYIYNQTGRGTEIKRLVDLYSINILTVRNVVLIHISHICKQVLTHGYC
ncbi:hypothetical protein PGT21_035615 [Puccinia graminis f. sp. tritici]|uniref:DUF6589 domain-containing protein n=2 Tax=Puccinia graminis f. sp. tritici TaxID=56615 RepID=A0A5B0PBK3_PUCGR|nr:hypothetical protein PGT21_035615 [Puccinia graminis f. sp. tritici]